MLDKFNGSRYVNDYLILLRADLLKHYNILLSTKDIVTPEDVKDSYKGVKPVKKTFLDLFRQFNQNLLERKEMGSLSAGRLKRFQVIYGKCKEFIMSKFKKSDVLLEEIKLNFIVEFAHHLRREDGIMNNSAMKYASDLKQVMKYGVMLEYLPSNPFVNFKCSYKKVKREFLDQDELDLLYKREFSIVRLEEVRDCYLFSCYTGYAYSDAEALGPEDVNIGMDGEKWIIRNRKKTETIENVPLLPIPLEIIQKYRNHKYCKAFNKLLPMNSNQRYNALILRRVSEGWPAGRRTLRLGKSPTCSYRKYHLFLDIQYFQTCQFAELFMKMMEYISSPSLVLGGRNCLRSPMDMMLCTGGLII